MKKSFRDLSFGPYVFLTPSVTHRSLVIFALLLCQVALLFVTKSYHSIILVVLSLLASVLAEFTSNKIRQKNSFLDFTCLTQGLLIGLFLPSSYPILPVFFVVYISLLLSKHIFGDMGKSWINPVAFTVAIFYLLGMNFFPENMIVKSIVENGQIELFSNESTLSSFAQKISDWLNLHVFGLFKIEVPLGYIGLLIDSGSTIPAFRFNFVTLVASIILISFELLDWIVPAVFICVYTVCIALFGQTFYTGSIGNGDVLISLFTSGILFTAFFVLDSYGTSPFGLIGKIVYAFFAGLIAFTILISTTSSIGNIFTVLLCNILSTIIQYAEEKFYLLRMSKSIRKKNYA